MSEIPEGYWENAKGDLVPITKIKEIDKVNEELIVERVKAAKSVNLALRMLKETTFEEINNFVDLSAAEYGVKRGGAKGNLRLFSFSGQFRIDVQNSDSIELGYQLEAAKALVDECLRGWSAESNDNIKALITGAFDIDKKGNLNTAKILALRSYKIDDPKWLRAMDAISDSIRISMSKKYVRFYERDAAGEYKAISLDFAAVSAVSGSKVA